MTGDPSAVGRTPEDVAFIVHIERAFGREVGVDHVAGRRVLNSFRLARRSSEKRTMVDDFFFSLIAFNDYLTRLQLCQCQQNAH